MSASSERRIARFREYVGRAGDGRYQPAQAHRGLVVTSVKRDSNGDIASATGTIDGSGEFTVPMKGHQANAGDILLVGYDAANPVGAELVYLRHITSARPVGKVVDANLPYPLFAATPWTTVPVVTPGSITARASVFFEAVEERYGPTQYVVTFRVGGGDWATRVVNHIGGTQEVNLGSDLPPGEDVDVNLTAVYGWGATESPPSPDSTFTLAADTSSPGAVTAIAVDNTAPNALRIKLTVSVDSDLLLGYIYQIATSPTGPAAQTTPPRYDTEWVAILPPNTYYVRAYPISKAGVAGTPSPATNFSGPYVVTDYSATLDITPPAAMGAPTLATRTSQFADGTVHGFLTATLPAYSAPADLAYYEVSIVANDGRAWIEQIPPGATAWDGEVGFAQFTVAVRAIDRAGNKQATFGPTAVATIASPALSGTAPTVTTSGRGGGVLVQWNAIAGALAYEVQRATDGSGTGATTIAPAVDARMFLDTLTANTIILPTYYYRARALSVSNGSVINGTWSSWVSGTFLAVDGQNLRAASITANELAANSVTANTILAGAITTGKLAADVTISTILRTGTSNVSRWVLEGATGSGTQNQLRFVEYVGGVDRQRLRLDPTGLYLIQDSGAVEAQFIRDSTGHGAISLGGAGAGASINVAWDTPLGQFVSNFNTYQARQRYRTSSKHVDFKAASSWGPHNDILVMSKEDGAVDEPVVVFGDLYSLGEIGIFPDWIELSGGADTSRLQENLLAFGDTRLTDTYLRIGNIAYYTGAPIQVRQPTTLANAINSSVGLTAFQYPAGGNNFTLRMYGFRGQAIGTSDWQDARVFMQTDVDNGGFLGGGLQLGARAYNPFFGLYTGTDVRLWWDHANTRVLIPNGLRIDGALSKASGSFVIPDPTPGHERDELRHCFVEGPTRGENLYTYVVTFGPRGGNLRVEDSEGRVVAGATVEATLLGPARFRVAIPLPDYWPHLNERPRCLTQGDGWGRSRAGVGDDLTTLTLEAEESGTYTILLIGTRKDPAARAWWDRRGHRKRAAQQWTNEGTRERRAERLAWRDSLRAAPEADNGVISEATAADLAAVQELLRQGQEEVGRWH